MTMKAKISAEIMNSDAAYHTMKDALTLQETVFHPDTQSSYAAYQFILKGGWDIWVNARGGTVISMGRTINRS